MKSTVLGILSVLAITFAASAARADEGSNPSSSDDGYRWGLALTLGEGMYFVHGHGVTRGPFSLEAVPSLGWSWFKFDLGVGVTIESLKVAGTDVGHWNLFFRPGARLTPPMIPLYLRFAIPLVVHRDAFDWGLMFGLGADIPIVGILGLVLEADTTLSKDLSWGGDGVPLEFRAGISLHF